MNRWILAACSLVFAISAPAASAMGATPPVAVAGPDQQVSELDLVTLDGTGSYDPDPGTVLQYIWTQAYGPTVVLNGANTAQPTFTAPNVTFSERLTFQLTVSDGVYSSSDTVDVVVSHVDLPPVADAGPDETVASNSIVTLNGLGSSDPDSGQSIRQYAWTQLAGPSVALIPTVTRPTPQFVAPTVTVTTVLTFELTVWDQQFLSSTDTVNITVVP